MKKLISIHTFETYVKTSDNWLPNYDNNTARIMLAIASEGFLETNPKYPQAFVSVWGADDFGLERCFYGDRLECIDNALSLYHTLTYNKDNITIQGCRDLNLVPI